MGVGGLCHLCVYTTFTTIVIVHMFSSHYPPPGLFSLNNLDADVHVNTIGCSDAIDPENRAESPGLLMTAARSIVLPFSVV